MSWRSRFDSRDPDQNSGQEDKRAAESDLEQSGHEGSVHESVPDPGDDAQFRQHNNHGDSGGRVDVGNQVGKRVAKAAEHGHQPANESARPGMAAASPTRNVFQLLCVANAAAKSGASVETEPSISPASPG